MKTKKMELEVDFIGGQVVLTVEEQKAISEYLNQKKIAASKKLLRKTKQKNATE